MEEEEEQVAEAPAAETSQTPTETIEYLRSLMGPMGGGAVGGGATGLAALGQTHPTQSTQEACHVDPLLQGETNGVEFGAMVPILLFFINSETHPNPKM